ncbi:unnamed protein product [Spirodela intermedia]|uniref:Uncharacterized protein n=1 Tax=Spirodela intermedia TaxID=51605 RepID=A0A7I8J7S0_SPIIN|nr:unnamed protein product [Spirodela intermedia]CAA6666111.1 unnamed protein product [Spirodela intermedia]
MEVPARSGDAEATVAYRLPPCRFCHEDVLFCVDVDVETQVEMKASGPKGRPIYRLDAIKQAILLFVSAKLSINPGHRFAFSVLERSFAWIRKEFSNEVDSARAAVQKLRASDSPSGLADLTQLFRVAHNEAKKSISQGRLFRVVLIYCRSSTRPQHQWPVSQKLFTLDVIYLHDKPGPENCPSAEQEGYIFESGQGLARVLFKQTCLLLCHPHQRCTQEDLDIPKSLARRSPPPADAAPPEDATAARPIPHSPA